MVAPAIIAALIGAGGSIISSGINKSGQAQNEQNDLLQALLAKQQQPQSQGAFSQPIPQKSFSSFLQSLGGM